ncbi:hypothetical protein NHX12_026525 [Muraenolepis orangiensis]|uniref:SH3 domain-containing protein n=1 Tax=Muraenolepis orangiensis TaxID=630683 RepID=A0A9Q0EKD3_9TELE|nr:hypothetical protein NHX12_026525 [Muraenolepis orangiensis]
MVSKRVEEPDLLTCRPPPPPPHPHPPPPPPPQNREPETRSTGHTATMAAAELSYPKSVLLLLLMLYFTTIAALDRRFSDQKICADEECSSLLVRGKMIDDFSGPDCRFLSAKKSEIVYVYYKLGGRRSDMWAGSETDFVCFDTGFSGHKDYDVDSLLGRAPIKQDGGDEDTLDQTETADSAGILLEPTDGSPEIVTVDNNGDDDKDGDGHDASNNTDLVPEDPIAYSPLPAVTTELARPEAVEQEPIAAKEAEAHADHSTAQEPQTAEDSTLETVEFDKRETDGEHKDDLKVEQTSGRETGHETDGEHTDDLKVDQASGRETDGEHTDDLKVDQASGRETGRKTDGEHTDDLKVEQTSGRETDGEHTDDLKVDQASGRETGRETDGEHTDDLKVEQASGHETGRETDGEHTDDLKVDQASGRETDGEHTDDLKVEQTSGRETDGEHTDDLKVDQASGKDPSSAGRPTYMWKQRAPGTRMTFKTTLDEVANVDEETGMAIPRDQAKVNEDPQKDPKAGGGTTTTWTRSTPGTRMTFKTTLDKVGNVDEETGMAIPRDQAKVNEDPQKDPKAGGGTTSMHKMTQNVPSLLITPQTTLNEATTDDDDDASEVLSVDEAYSEEPIEEEYSTDSMVPLFFDESSHLPRHDGPQQALKADNSNTDDDDEEEEEEEDDDDDIATAENGWSSLGDTVYAIVSGGRRTADVSRSKKVVDQEKETTPGKRLGAHTKDVDVPPAEQPEDEDLADEDSLLFLEPDPEEIDDDPLPLLFDHTKNDNEKHSVVEHTIDRENVSTEENPQEISTTEHTDTRGHPVSPSSHPLDTEAPEEPIGHQMPEHPEPGEEDNIHKVADDDEVRADEVASRSQAEDTSTRHVVLPVVDAEVKENYTDAPDEEGGALKQDSKNFGETNVTGEPEIKDDPDTDKELPTQQYDVQEEEEEEEEEGESERGELLEDENAILSSEPHEETDTPDWTESEATAEPSRARGRAGIRRRHIEAHSPAGPF